MSWYVDSSAILSIIFGEYESGKLGPIFREETITSELSRVEVLRTVTKTDAQLLPNATKLLGQFNFIGISNLILQCAANYPVEITVKTLDAIHLATAEALAPLIDGVVTFDKQMARNAQRLNLKVFEIA